MASAFSLPRPTDSPTTSFSASTSCPFALLDFDVVDASIRLLELYRTPEIMSALDFRVPQHAALLLDHVHHVLPPGQPLPAPEVIEALVERLLDVTVPGGPLDTQRLGTDAVWALAVGQLLDLEPITARRVAGAYAERIDRLGMEDDHMAHPVIAATAAYAVALTELTLGRTVRAARWSREGSCHTEHESPGLSVAAYLRAVALLTRRGDSSLSMDFPYKCLLIFRGCPW